MKSLLYILFIFSSCLVYGQEICDNAIDDDGDGLIDLNDEDCECSGGVDGELASLIPNPSFEDRDCCPTGFGQLHCAETWIQASTATSDYYNNCDFNTPTGYDATWFDPETPLPGGGGDGFVGFISNNSGYLEYVGAHLISPLLAGTEYTLNMYTAYANGYVDFEFSLFGTPEPTDLPWLGTSCPVPGGDWELLTSLDIVYTPDGAWQEITLTFTPAVDIYAIAIGGPCNPDPPAGPDGHNYYYVDGLTLIDSESFNSAISESGDWCDGDLALEASTDTSGGTWQWYKDGVALIGETDEVIDIMPYGLGDYSAVYFLGDDCIRKNHSVDEGEIIEVDFDFDNICAGQEFTFSNTSIVGPGVSPDWDWDFGDGVSSDDENPSHVFDEPGVYDVELIGLNDVGCNDTILKEVTVYPIPDANLEFVVNGVSSEDGGTGGCVLNDVQFNDISSIESGSIVDWAWSFGDGGVSDEENPIHTYGAAGTYTVTLVVTSDAGCSDVYELEIVMTNSLTLDLIINEPSCFGFSDGSITVNVEGAAGDLVFVISDEDGVTINEDNSNTANTLSTGWYYFDVSDGSGCDAIDSLFLDQPGELDIDLTITDPLCFGFETGWVKVNEVFNATGDYADISYIWNPNPAGIGGVFADSSYHMGAGDYTLTINDENGCSKTFDFEVGEPDSMYFSEFEFEPAYCRLHGYQSGNGVVIGAATGGTPDFDYLWTHLESGETTDYSTWGGRNPGNYELTVTDENGCVLTQTLFLDSLNPIAEFSVTSEQLNGDLKGIAPVEALFTNLSENYANPNNPLADTTFFWNLDRPNDDWQISHSYFETFDTTYLAKGETYTVDVCLVALNKNGCSDTTCKVITVYEPEAFTPINIFTPNGDGVNDVFTFNHRAASIDELTCVIVNRWGIVVHEMTDVTDEWDGTDNNGSPCKDGTYFYTYRYVTDNGTVKEGQGNIRLVSGN